MDWKQIGEEIAKIGLPLLGSILPIPGGASIGAALASVIGSPSAKPEDILATLTQSADAMVKAKEFEQQHQENLIKMAYDYEIEQRKLDSSDLVTVNQTIQSELSNSKDEAWYQKAWRPFNGFAVGAGSFFSVLATCFLFYKAIVEKDMTALTMVPQLASSVATILAVPGAAVGIAAWHRGRAQIAEIQSSVKS